MVKALAQEAEYCRRRATAFTGRPKALVLLRIGREFDRLAEANSKSDSQSLWHPVKLHSKTVRPCLIAGNDG